MTKKMTKKQKPEKIAKHQSLKEGWPITPPKKAAATSADPVVYLEEKSEKDFPIVGIGASAGGLEALELFLANVPEDSGMAFVIVQHLDPMHKGIMAELLQHGTTMPVAQVKDRTRVKPDCVYIIAPNKDMSILHGVLHLLDPIAPRGLRLPIDFFFRALADDQQEHSIGVNPFGHGFGRHAGLARHQGKSGCGLCTGTGLRQIRRHAAQRH